MNKTQKGKGQKHRVSDQGSNTGGKVLHAAGQISNVGAGIATGGLAATTYLAHKAVNALGSTGTTGILGVAQSSLKWARLGAGVATAVAGSGVVMSQKYLNRRRKELYN